MKKEIIISKMGGATRYIVTLNDVEKLMSMVDKSRDMFRKTTREELCATRAMPSNSLVSVTDAHRNTILHEHWSIWFDRGDQDEDVEVKICIDLRDTLIYIECVNGQWPNRQVG